MIRSKAPANAHSGIIPMNHVNGAPFRYRRNNGGSPSGVRRPPQFATAAIKNKIV